MHVERLDHLVLTVKDIDKAVQFYSTVLGMEPIHFGDGRLALKFGEQKINLHMSGHEFEPKAKNASTGSADLCFIIDQSIDSAITHLLELGVPIIEGPVSRTGATGPIISAYFRDPDGNLIEVSNYDKK